MPLIATSYTGEQTQVPPMASLVRGGRECLGSWVTATRSSPRLPLLPTRCRPPIPLPSPYPCCSHYHQHQLRPASTSRVSKGSSTIKREGKTAEHRVTRVVPFTCEQLFGKSFSSSGGQERRQRHQQYRHHQNASITGKFPSHLIPFP